MAEAANVAPANANGEEGDQGFFNGRLLLQVFLFTTVMNLVSQRGQAPQQAGGPPGSAGSPGSKIQPVEGLRNLYGVKEDCELLVHYGYLKESPSLSLLRDDSAAREGGYLPLWHEHVVYDSNATEFSTQVGIGPLPNEALHADSLQVPHLHATLLRRNMFLAVERGESVPPEEVVQSSMPLVVTMKNLDSHSGESSLWSSEEEEVQVNHSAKVPYFKTKLDIRPVVDHTAFQQAASQQGPFARIKKFPDLGVYQPQLFISDFWLLEKDYLELNETSQNRTLNLTLSYSAVSLFSWSIQVQMAEQWMQQSEYGLTDTQRDSFMLKRLYLDTNPYFLAFSAAFIILHSVFSMLAFKNDIQFWRQNESMKGLSARSMMVSFVMQLITAVYLLNSRETSRLLLFEIVLDTGLAFWKLRKAIKIEVVKEFPFISFGGQKGYEEAGTDKYDEEALRYMYAIAVPLFIGFTIRSSLYEKHRGWYTFIINTAAGGVYTFGFVMMTPQLYINYKLQSVEHMPWKALTYKAMSTFVDDVSAFLIDMPLMHRLACFRDDIIFFIYIYQRWKYRVDKTRISTWVENQPEEAQTSARSEGEAETAQAENRDSFGPRKPAGLDGDSCTQDTGGSCYFFGCADWRNAECVEGSCVCRADQCSVNGQCLPHEWAQKPEKPTAQGFGRDHPVKGKGNFTALVLSGGGAKGAFELGVLEGICKNNSLNHLRNWSMIVGTSIGAMNAGALAQFPPEAQCSKALAAAQSFWDSIKAPEDVWVSSDLAEPSSPDPVKNREPCMTSSRIMSMALAFYRRGGLCDPVPGRNAFEFAVQKDRIRSSGMMLRVVATSLKTGQAKWWDENSDTIIQGCEASGAIAPIIYPMEVDHEAFVDGGFVANTPIMKALQDGAQTVLVVNLDPLSTSGLISNLQALQKADTNVGLRIMQSEFNIMQQRYFLEHELQMACWGFPDRKILAYTPTKDPGDFLSFSSVALQRMRDQGVQTVNETEPVDLCELFFKHYSTDKPNKEERAALAGRPPPVVYAARLRGAPAKLHALTSSTSSQSALSLQQWMDMRFTTCCFLLGLLAGFSLKQSCVRSSLLPYPELDV